MNSTHYDIQSKYFDDASRNAVSHIKDASSRKELEVFLDFLKIKDLSNMKILEVGAGTGRYTIHLLDKNGFVTATEISRESLNTIEKQASDIGRQNNLTVLHDSLEIPIFRDEFDLVFCVNLLHHVEDMDNVFKTMCIAAKPGGKVAIIEPNPINPLFYIDFFRKGNWEIEKGILRCTRISLMKLFHQNQLKNIKLKRYIIIPNFIVKKLSFLEKINDVLLKIPLFNELYMFHMIYAEK